jgi:ATP-dependent DNA helicase 2 subunit 2
MAEKEATVFIIDLGSTMAKCNNGRTESDLDWSMRFVWDKISHIVSLNRKTLCVGVIGLRTDKTSNSMEEEEGYGNISVLQQLGPMGMSSLKMLSHSIKPSSTDIGDAISAIVLAVDMINTYTKQLKYNRKIILVTDAMGPLDGDGLTDISDQVNAKKITLTILYVRIHRRYLISS